MSFNAAAVERPRRSPWRQALGQVPGVTLRAADVLARRDARSGEIKNDVHCMAGCDHGTGNCPEDWYPSRSDECNPMCGRIFEPFW